MKKTSLVKLLQNHPGVPGFDAKYEFEVTLQGTRLFGDCCIIVVEDQRVKIRGLSIIVPSEVRESNLYINIKFIYTIKQEQIATYKLEFEKWEKIFEDDFCSNDRFLANWDLQNPYGTRYDPDRNAEFMPENVYIEQNQLVLEIREASYSVPQCPKFTCASMSSKNSFRTKYGCFSACVKLPDKGGTWSSFRLIGDENQIFIKNPYDITQSKGEISVFSYFPCLGETLLTSMTYYGHEKYTKQFMKINSVDGIMDGFATISCIWTPSILYYYYNNNLIYTINEQVDKIENELFLFFQLQIGYQNKYDWIGNFDKSMLPQKFVIDNIKVYKV